MEKAVQTESREVQDLSSVQFLTITAAFVALTYIFTAFINVKLPIAANGGLIHLGNVPLFIGAILFGKKTGAIAGGIGMGLFDLLSGCIVPADPFPRRFDERHHLLPQSVESIEILRRVSITHAGKRFFPKISPDFKLLRIVFQRFRFVFRKSQKSRLDQLHHSTVPVTVSNDLQ